MNPVNHPNSGSDPHAHSLIQSSLYSEEYDPIGGAVIILGSDVIVTRMWRWRQLCISAGVRAQFRKSRDEVRSIVLYSADDVLV